MRGSCPRRPICRHVGSPWRASCIAQGWEGKCVGPDIGISFQCMPGVRKYQAERSLVALDLVQWVGTALSAYRICPSRYL